MNKINWKKVKEQFEKEMFDKLRSLPGHHEVPPNLFKFRLMISHEIPESAPKKMFQKLIRVLLKGDKIDLEKLREKYLLPELERESKILKEREIEFGELQKLAKVWVESNLSEDELQKQWKNHETWLPRRYTIYENPDLPFQKIAIDTLSRYYLITSNVKILS